MNNYQYFAMLLEQGLLNLSELQDMVKAKLARDYNDGLLNRRNYQAMMLLVPYADEVDCTKFLCNIPNFISEGASNTDGRFVEIYDDNNRLVKLCRR